MSVKRMLLLAAGWLLLCVAVIEPVFISPMFHQTLGWEVAQASITAALDTPISLPVEQPTMSMDHFRVVCLVYFGLPALAYWVISTVQCDKR